MTDKEILQLLTNSGALLNGHFILTSGLHSPQYVEKFRLLENPRLTEQLCAEIVKKFDGGNITVVVGPMTGGIILAHEVGKQLGVKAIFTERVDGKMKFKRGFTLSANERVLVVEDIITTGGSVQEVIDAIHTQFTEENPVIIGIGCLVDRSSGRAKFDFPFKPLLTMEVVTYQPGDCPLCKSGSVAVKPGSTNK